MSESNSKSGGVSVIGLLGVAFVVLKLTKVINWSWFLILLPSILMFIVTLILIAVALIAYLKGLL